ncbi:MAG: hypothetical protein JF603_14530 [Acidobacteria bacterium]|nr:hypothetical protein [Acidobacteriota bacterium]
MLGPVEGLPVALRQAVGQQPHDGFVAVEGPQPPEEHPEPEGQAGDHQAGHPGAPPRQLPAAWHGPA